MMEKVACGIWLLGVHRAELARMTILIENDKNKEWNTEPRWVGVCVCVNSEMAISTQVTGRATKRK